MHTLVMGLGNELLGDEGVGVHTVRLLLQEKWPEDIVIAEVGTALLDALDYLAGVERLIVIDAMKGGEAPGTIYRITLADCQENPCIASMHGFDVFRLMALAGKSPTTPVLVFGVEPALLSWSLELSATVNQSMPRLIEALRSEIV